MLDLFCLDSKTIGDNTDLNPRILFAGLILYLQ